MTLQIARMIMLVVSTFMLGGPKRAHAHAGAAPPPIFDPGPCILTVDRSAQPELALSYQVEVDGVPLTEGDIGLPDAMTHQFFAFRGAIVFEGFVPELWSFDRADRMIAPLPLWINDDDVTRAQNSSDSERYGYDLSPAHDALLEKDSALAQRWLRITPDDARAPITHLSALMGVRWPLGMVAPGLYSIAAYIFSPPYNGWGIRSGLVKVTDADHDPAAAVADRIQETLFSGQGRIVRACLDVPSGTRLTTWALAQDRPDGSWVQWGAERSAETGTFEDCFDPGKAGLAGALRLRFDLTDPSGALTSFYSPDTLSVLAGALPCEASDTICCPARPAADGCGDSQLCDAVSAGAPGETAASPDAGPEPPAPQARSHSGCAVAHRALGSGPTSGWIALLLGLLCLGSGLAGRWRNVRFFLGPRTWANGSQRHARRNTREPVKTEQTNR